MLPLATSLALLLLPLTLRPGRGEPRRPWPPEVSPFLRVCWWINRFYCLAVHRLVVLNPSPIPDIGPALLIANHSAGIDHFILQGSCRRVLGFLIAKEFYDLPVGGRFCKLLGCIPVNRNGRDLSATRAALRALEEGRVVPIFPEGRIIRTSGREFAEGKPGSAFLAMKSKVPVIPAYIRGTPIVAGVLEAWLRPSRVRVMFGPPVDLSDLIPDAEGGHLEEKAAIQAVTQRLMEAIKALQAPSLAAEPE